MSTEPDVPMDRILHDLQERAKELACLYRIDEILSRTEALRDALPAIVQALPSGFQFPGTCSTRIVLAGQVHEAAGFTPSPYALVVPILVQGENEGTVEAYYGATLPEADEGPFLKEERKLLETVADRIGQAFTSHGHGPGEGGAR